MLLTDPAFNWIIFSSPRSNYLFIFFHIHKVNWLSRLRDIAKTFIMPFEIKKIHLSENSVVLSDETEMKSRAEEYSDRDVLFDFNLSLCFKVAHCDWGRGSGVGHRPDNTGRTLCMYAGLNACAHTNEHTQAWGQLLVNVLLFSMHLAGDLPL